MRIVACGENLIDLIPAETISTAESRWSALVGGSPLNTSLALAKLGAPTQFLGRIGSDSFGRQIEEHLRVNGVGLDLAVRTEDPTSLAVVSLDEEGKAEYDFHFDGTSGFSWREGELPELNTDDWLHFGSIGFVVGSGVDALREFVRTTKASTSFDINVRPTVIADPARYLATVEPLMEAVGAAGGIVKASDDDINWLSGTDQPLDQAEAWIKDYGLSMFLVTLGSDGAVALRPDSEPVAVASMQIDLVDTVGAGDTFMAGFLSQYVFDPGDLELALQYGAAASALVCTRKGANPPTLEEVNAFMRQ